MMFGQDNGTVSVACASAELQGTLADMFKLVDAGRVLAKALANYGSTDTNRMFGAGYFDKLNEAWAPYGVRPSDLKVANVMRDEDVNAICEILRNLHHMSRPEVEPAPQIGATRVYLERVGQTILNHYLPQKQQPPAPTAPIAKSWVFYAGLGALGLALGGIFWLARERNRMTPKRRRR